MQLLNSRTHHYEHIQNSNVTAVAKTTALVLSTTTQLITHTVIGGE